MEPLIFDQENYAALGGLGWLQVIVGTVGFLVIGGFGAAFTLHAARSAIRAASSRDRLTASLIALGAGAGVWFGGRAVFGLLARMVFASEDDFTSAQVVVDEVLLSHVWHGEVARFPASELVGVEVHCRPVEVSGEEGYECLRSAAVTLTDGRVFRVADTLPWGLSPCPGAAAPWVAHGERMLAAGRRSGGTRVSGAGCR